MSRRFSEPFVPLPRRLYDAFAHGELPFDAVGILGCLAALADRRRDPPEVVMPSIGALLEWLRWPQNQYDTLTRRLRLLRKQGWIDFDRSQGQRSSLVIRLLGSEVTSEPSAELPHDFRKAEGGSAEVNFRSAEGDERAIPLHESARAVPQLPHSRARAETETETENSSPTVVGRDDGAGLSIKNEQRRTPLDPIAALAAEVADPDALTEHTYRKHFGQRLPEAAFRAALESLLVRRADRSRPPLESEAKYVFAALETMVEERRYA
jgi:hypothetical protein